MTKKLPILKKNNRLTLSKTKNLINITNKILIQKPFLEIIDDGYLNINSEIEYLYDNEQNLIEIDKILQELEEEKNNDLVDDSWIERLWDWADKNHIPDLTWIEDNQYKERGYIKGFPREKEKLLNLKVLDLYDIHLSVLIKEIGQLTNLVEFSLAVNELIKLPKEISNLYNLELLNLSANKLIELPKEIFNITNLIYLYLGDNKLTSLPIEIGNLINLNNLNLSLNYLIELPKEIVNLTKLTYLNLVDNPMMKLSSEQKTWIMNLKKSGCDVEIDDDLFDRVLTSNSVQLNRPLRIIDMVDKTNNTKDGIFGNINNDLNDFSITPKFENNMLMQMAYAYARRSVAAGLFLQGVFNRESYQQASTIFKILQRQTGQTVEFQQEASNQALELLFSYNSRLTNTMISKIVTVVELKQVVSAYEHNIYHQFNDMLDFFEEEDEESSF